MATFNQIVLEQAINHAATLQEAQKKTAAELEAEKAKTQQGSTEQPTRPAEPRP